MDEEQTEFYKDSITRKLHSISLMVANFGFATLESEWFDVYVSSNQSNNSGYSRVASFEKRSLVKMFEKEIEDFLKKNGIKMEYHKRKKLYIFKKILLPPSSNNN